MSVQYLLHGLIDEGNIISSERTVYENNPSSPSLPPTPFFQHTLPSTIRDTPSPSNTPPLTIQLRHQQDEALNLFDRSPALLRSLVQIVARRSPFHTTDTRASTLATPLATHLPGLASLPSHGPSGINWIHAVDHFICRRSHGLSLTEFSHFRTTEEDTLWAIEDATLTHLSWRFRQLFMDEVLLAAMAGSMMGELKKRMWGTVREEGRPPPFVL